MFVYILMYNLHVKETQKCMRHAMTPKYILTPNLGFLPQIIYRYALSSTLLELTPEVKVTVTWNSWWLARVQDVSTYQIWNATINKIGDLLWVHFCQELTPEIKVTVDENSERHSLITTYIHKLNLWVNMAYNMRHALTGFAQTWKNLTLVLENSRNLKKGVFCPRIVLEFCKIILENMN